MNSETAVKRPNPPLRSCLHCRWYTAKKHFCCKNLSDPIRPVLGASCYRWTISDDARRAWRDEPKNETERWAQRLLQSMFRKLAYPDQPAGVRGQEAGVREPVTDDGDPEDYIPF